MRYQLFQPVARGTESGMSWESLIELLFIMPRAGAAVDAASGARGGWFADLGITDDFTKQAARTLRSGNAALFLLIRKMTTDKVLAAWRGAGATVMRQFVRRNQGRDLAGGTGEREDGDY